MAPLLIVGVFILGAGAGGLCVMVQQIGIRSEFQKELENQFDKALFDSVRQKRLQSPPAQQPTKRLVL
jgi:uncharacterized membrane protein